MTDRQTLLDLAAKIEAADGPSRDAIMPLLCDAQDRFWSKVDALGAFYCWEWKASAGGHGYGQFSVGSRKDGTYRMLRAHRVAYMLANGFIPTSAHLDHLCNNKRCVNPRHLDIVDIALNNRREAYRRAGCHAGHEDKPENFIIWSDGRRQCRICTNERKRRYRKDSAAALKAMAASTTSEGDE